MSVSLDAALSGLRIAQQSLDTVSGNIANASTPGYTRKILPQETLVVAGVGHGVKSSAITRIVDMVLERDIITQGSLSGNQEVTQKYLDRIQDFSGPSGGGQSLSATISALSQSFSSLSDSPDNILSLTQTLATAQQTATKFNDFSTLLTRMRLQTETEIGQDVNTVNAALKTVATLNGRINALQSQGTSSADLEDQRDQAIRTVAQYMDVGTFKAGNGMVFVTTKQGLTLADTTAPTLSFNASNLLPGSYYPGGGVNGLLVGTTDIAGLGIGGAMGALLDLRDTIIPTYTAQIDEEAQKLAFRMDQQGLTLFTDSSGSVPANVASPGIVGYVGFAANIRVNTLVTADPTLIRSGTSGGPVQPGSNEVINRISQYAFGANAYQQATGTANISAGTIFASSGMTKYNKVTGNTAITSYTPVLTSNPAIPTPPGGAKFNLTINGGPYLITVAAADTALDLVTKINAAAGSNVAALNGLGQLMLTGNTDITFADVSLGAPGIAALGFSFATYPAQNPSFTVQAGTQAPVTITVHPLDTSVDLLAALNAITGITASLSPGGALVITPTDGGGLTISNTVGTPLAALGMTVANVAHTAFRQTNLGPAGTLSTGLLGNATLEDFARSIMADQAEDSKRATDAAEQTQSYLQTLDKRQSDGSGVNIDEELSNMIRIQSAYTAAAKMLTASERMLDDLFAAFR